jgi:serine/threonine-protein kinase RsbW
MPATAAESVIATACQTQKAEQPAVTITEYQRTYQGRADQVRHVRSDVASYLGDSPITNDAVLVASEIASNAILHSRSRGAHFTIRVALHRDHARVECRDAGGPWRRRRQDDRPHGLAVVEALTGPGAWGIETTGDGGRVVWTTLAW